MCRRRSIDGNAAEQQSPPIYVIKFVGSQHSDTATNVGYINSQRVILGLGTYFNVDYFIGVRALLAFQN